VHVDDGISLDHHGRLWLVLNPTLAGERETDLVGHGAAEGTLGQKKRHTREACFYSSGWFLLFLQSPWYDRPSFLHPQPTCPSAS
jgi:hypothetical protein